MKTSQQYSKYIVFEILSFCFSFTLSILWANSATDKMIFIVSIYRKCKILFSAINMVNKKKLGDNLHEMSNPVVWKK